MIECFEAKYASDFALYNVYITNQERRRTMPHAREKKMRELLQRRMSPHEAEEELQRRKTIVHFSKIEEDLIPDAVQIYESPEFKTKIKKHPLVRDFIKSFWKWNEYALPLMNSNSYPYISLQRELAKMVSGFLGEVLVDLGSGAGDFCARLFEINGKEVKKIFAIDIDAWCSLSRVPETLKNSGYRNKVALVQTSSMSKLPIWDKTVDCVVSNLGGVTYAGWWFENGELICDRKDALVCCLKDINRILKLGGILGFSSLVPSPNFSMIFKHSIMMPLRHFDLKPLMMTLRHGLRIKTISQFMRICEQNENAHYLTVEDWSKYLNLAGFEIVSASTGKSYAKQGVVIVAKKNAEIC